MAWLRNSLFFRELALIGSIALVPGGPFLYGQAQQQGQAPGSQQQQLINPQQMDSLVAPIALYPDTLVAQVLAASTYPLQIVTARRWVEQHGQLKGKGLVDAAGREDWDPSIQALVAFPQVLQMMDSSLDWTTALGNAFLAQQSDVMAAVQRMRMKAQQSGNLESTTQQQVQTTTVEGQPTVVIQPTDPQVMYVPSYEPAAVYGAASEYYPYPSVSYPSYPVAAGAIAFGTGIAIGAIFNNNSGWGWGCNWGRHPSLYVNNNFFSSNRSAFVNRGNWGGAYAGAGRAGWNHNPRYRGAVPYANRDVANRFNGGRPGSMRPAQLPSNIGNIRPPSGAGLPGNIGNRPGAGRPGAGMGAGQLPGRPGGGQGIGGGARPSQLPANVGGNRPANIGNRPSQMPSSIGSASRAVQGGQWGGWSGKSAMPANRGNAFSGGGARQMQQFSNRGGHSMGGGGFRGGGGGGGFRGGGGGGRSRGGGGGRRR